MIHVLATVAVRPGQRDSFLREFHRVVPAVRAEAGCIEYGPAVDVASGIAVQGPVRPDVVVIIEKWASLDALKTHLQAPHMHEYRGRVRDLVENVTLQILAPA
jgi:quinol monooxygenase YgiN